MLKNIIKHLASVFLHCLLAIFLFPAGFAVFAFAVGLPIWIAKALNLSFDATCILMVVVYFIELHLAGEIKHIYDAVKYAKLYNVTLEKALEATSSVPSLDDY